MNRGVSKTINQIKSKLLVLGAVSTTINDQGCQHVTGSDSLKKDGRMGYICSVASLSKSVE